MEKLIHLKSLMIFLITLAFSIGAAKGKHGSSDQDSMLIDKIYKLQEVQAKETYLQKTTNGKAHIAIIVLTKPTKKIPYYLVQVGYDNSIRFEVYYTFRINIRYTTAKDIQPYIQILNFNSTYVNLVNWRKSK